MTFKQTALFKSCVLTFLIVYAFSCKAQQIALSDTVSINLLAKTEKLNKEGFSSNIRSRFAHSKMAMNSIPASGERMDNKHFYLIDNVLVQLTHGQRPIPIQSDYLQKLKKEMDRLNKLSPFPSYTSIIKTINNHEVLTIYYDFEDIGYYTFYCSDSTKTKALNGILQFDVGDKARAIEIANELIQSIKLPGKV